VLRVDLPSALGSLASRRSRWVTRLCLVIGLALAVTLPSTAVASDAPVEFPDAHLDSAVRAAIGKPTGQINASDLSTLTALAAPGSSIERLDGLEYATNLVSLDLGSNSITTITPLAGIGGLAELTLSSNLVTDLAPLARLSKLTTITARYCPLSDIGPTSTMTGLVSFDAYGCQIATLTPLAGLTGLKSLQLGGNHITTVTPLAGLTNLEVLYLNQNDLTDISSLAPLTAMKKLGVASNHISSLSAVAGMSELERLLIDGNQISDLAPLAGLSNLTECSANFNPIHHFGALGSLTKLKYLTFYGDDISTITPVAGFPDLETFIVGPGVITDLSPLVGHPKLWHLEVWGANGSNFADLTPLSGLTALQQLILQNGHISDVSPLAGLSKLSYLAMRMNDIEDITPLASTHASRIDVRLNYLDLNEGSSAKTVINGWLGTHKTVDYELQKGGTVVGLVRAAGRGPLVGVVATLAAGRHATCGADGSFSILTVMPGEHAITFSKPYYYSYTTTFTVSESTTSVVNALLAPIQIVPTIARSPRAASLTYRRRRGVAKFTLAATITDARGAVPGATVWLQKSSGGKWKTLYRLTTNAAGKVSKAFAVKKRGSSSYRWYAPATAYDRAAATGRQKVLIR
jgi:internalin A